MDILQLPGGGRDIKEEGGGRAEAMGRERGGENRPPFLWADICSGKSRQLRVITIPWEPMLRVLYIDDEPDLLGIGKTYLEATAGFFVDTLTSAADALTDIAEKPYDAVVSDYQMPGMDGIAFLKAVRASGNPIPFILFTGRGREEIVIQALNEGADFYIQKGGDPKSQFAELAHKITRAVDARRYEKALRTSEVRFRSIIQRSDDIIIVIDRAGKITYASPAIGTVLGYTEEELLGKDPLDLVHPDDRDRIANTLAGLFAMAGKPRLHEYRAVRADGTVVYLESIGSNHLGIPEIDGVVIASRDITKRRKTEEALRESEAKYRMVVDQSYDAVFIAQDERLAFHNPAFAALTGYTGSELEGKPIAGLIAPEDRAVVMSRHRQRLEGQSPPATYGFSVLHRDGSTRVPVIMNISFGKIGGRPATFGTLHNIAGDREREAALRESEELYRKLVATVPDIVVRTDLDGAIVYANDRTLDLAGCSSDREILGKPVFRFFAPEDLPRALANTKLMFERQLGPVEYAFVTDDGRRHVLEINGDVLRNPDGSPHGMVFVGRDMTQRRKAEEGIQNAHRQLTLLSSITRHDIMNKVAILQGYLALAEEEPDRRKIQEFIRNLKNAAEDIADQLEFSRIYGSLGTEAPRWYALGSLVSLLRVPDSVQIEMPPGWIEVSADPMIEMVFENLLDNSLRHGEHVSRVRVTARQEGGSLVLAWEDNGAGIPAGEKERIFGRGYGKHTGMGLFLIREILGITGITIAECGEPGKSARFEMVVPEGEFRIR